MVNFNYEPSAELISGVIKKLQLTKDTCLIYQPTMFGDWRFSAIADYLCEELGAEDVWRLKKETFKNGCFAVISDIDISGKIIVNWNIPENNSVLIFTNFSDLGTGAIGQWIKIGETFREEGVRPKIVTQLPPYKIDRKLIDYLDIYILYDDKIISLGDIGRHDTTDEVRARELIIAFSQVETLSAKELAAFRKHFEEFSSKDYPLYLEYLVLTHEDINYSSEDGTLRLSCEERVKYNRYFEKLDHYLRSASLGFFSINNIKLFSQIT